MTTVTFSQLRNNARKYFDMVARGEELEVYRHGKPLAIISPSSTRRPPPRPAFKPLLIPGVSLSQTIIAEREEGYGK